MTKEEFVLMIDMANSVKESNSLLIDVDKLILANKKIKKAIDKADMKDIMNISIGVRGRALDTSIRAIMFTLEDVMSDNDGIIRDKFCETEDLPEDIKNMTWEEVYDKLIEDNKKSDKTDTEEK